MFNLGYYHGYNGYLVSDDHCQNKEYIDGYHAGMQAEDERLERELRQPAPAYLLPKG